MQTITQKDNIEKNNAKVEVKSFIVYKGEQDKTQDAYQGNYGMS